jgi:hypothetical protein
MRGCVWSVKVAFEEVQANWSLNQKKGKINKTAGSRTQMSNTAKPAIPHYAAIPFIIKSRNISFLRNITGDRVVFRIFSFHGSEVIII